MNMLEIEPQNRGQNPFAATLEAYLERTLHVRVNLSPWAEGDGLPVFLTRAYTLFEAEIAHTHIVVLASKRDDLGKPSNIAKHINIVEAAFGGIVVYAAPTISATLRARLLDAGIAFAVPGNQLYIPALAMDLRERYRRPKTPRPEKLSPSAQAVLFRHLLFRRENSILTPSTLADPLRYSPMTIGRAFDELAAVSLAKIERHGREKHLTFTSEGRLLVDVAKTLLISPVSKRYPVQFRQDPSSLHLSGLSALTRLTDLSGNDIGTFAVSPDRWRNLKTDNYVDILPEEYAADAIIETWRYDPHGLSEKPIVDPLSLYAQFWDHDDARISMAADKLLERWS